MWSLQGLWQRILHAGDISGKVMTLIALPSAIFAVIIFFNEIGDTLTRPDVSAQVASVGLRCGPYIDRGAVPTDRPNAFKIQKCMEADLSAWVKLDLENEDAINRTLASIALRLHFPDELGLSDKPVAWTETRLVNHIIESDVQTTQRWPWTAMLMAPGSRVPLELDFRPFRSEDQVAFVRFVDLIKADPSPLSDLRIPVEILGSFSGADGWQVIGTCEIDITKSSIDTKRRAPVIRGLTRRCV
ncbi:hypothetical protein [uncultured Tateyamaria sp.]|uniref:hypothetical protein n=1 Tax=uncultured Tateyamaria sp. TaxID=455651 RepID=UPI00260C77BD|nr:hypothetical protein [uncultured Tateyamaria sp.]